MDISNTEKIKLLEREVSELYSHIRGIYDMLSSNNIGRGE